MINFEYQNPTRIIFGKGSINKLGKEILKYGNKVLLVYGSGSIKKNGIYDTLTNNLKENNIIYTEYPNITVPSLANLRKGIALAKQAQADIIIGIGGGVCIDMAKSIAVGAANEVDIWDVLTKKVDINSMKVLPIGAVVTVAGSGSEMDGNSEIDDLATGIHGSIGSFVKTYPTFSILDPELTYTVPFNVTAYHGVCIMIQALEQHFCPTEHTPIQNGFIETICKSVIDSLKVLQKDPANYDARANIMWASALTTNRIIGRGKEGYWLAGPLGGMIDDKVGISYSQGIAITWPKYMMTCYKDFLNLYKSFAINVMRVDPTNKSDEEIAKEGTIAFQKFFDELGLAHTLKDLHKNYTPEDFEEEIQRVAKRGLISEEDLRTIIQLSI